MSAAIRILRRSLYLQGKILALKIGYAFNCARFECRIFFLKVKMFLMKICHKRVCPSNDPDQRPGRQPKS